MIIVLLCLRETETYSLINFLCTNLSNMCLAKGGTAGEFRMLKLSRAISYAD